MEENKNNKLMENIVGILLILPLYIVLLFSDFFVNFVNVIGNDFAILSLAMYGFIILGLFLAYKEYNYKIKEKYELFRVMCIIIAFFMIISIFSFFMFYVINDLNDLNYFFNALFSNFIIRIVSTILYGNFFGTKKAIILYVIYVLIFVCCVRFGLLA